MASRHVQPSASNSATQYSDHCSLTWSRAALAGDGGGEQHHRGEDGEVGDEPGRPLGRQVLGHLDADGQAERPAEVERLGEVALDEVGADGRGARRARTPPSTPTTSGTPTSRHARDHAPVPHPTSTTERAPVSPITRAITARADASDAGSMASRTASSYGVGSVGHRRAVSLEAAACATTPRSSRPRGSGAVMPWRGAVVGDGLPARVDAAVVVDDHEAAGRHQRLEVRERVDRRLVHVAVEAQHRDRADLGGQLRAACRGTSPARTAPGRRAGRSGRSWPAPARAPTASSRCSWSRSGTSTGKRSASASGSPSNESHAHTVRPVVAERREDRPQVDRPCRPATRRSRPGRRERRRPAPSSTQSRTLARRASPTIVSACGGQSLPTARVSRSAPGRTTRHRCSRSRSRSPSGSPPGQVAQVDVAHLLVEEQVAGQAAGEQVEVEVGGAGDSGTSAGRRGHAPHHGPGLRRSSPGRDLRAAERR